MKVVINQNWSVKDFDGLIVTVDQSLLISDSNEILALPIKTLKEKKLFEGKIGEVHNFSLILNNQMVEVGLVGIGDEKSFSETKLRKGIAEAYRNLKTKKVTKIGIECSDLKKVSELGKKTARIISETIIMSDYEFNNYKSDTKENSVVSVEVSGHQLDEASFNEGIVLGETNVFSRHLTNMPANIMTPNKLAELTIEYGEKSGFEVEIKDLEAIKALNMHAYLAVASGSHNPPKLIVMRYKGNPDSDQTLGYVGKGLTYDSGGLSIKSTASMLTMKDDMGGASAVISTMGAISRMQLKINVVAVVAACENMISGICYKPGDIISSMGGKSIFIGNTDAEGRLTLVDAVTYIIKEEKVDFVLDIATLTGAAIHCLGIEASPAISNSDDFYSNVEKAFHKSDEKIWRFPIFDEYKELVKNDQADLTNTAGSPGTITAGIFIGEFVNDTPWVHIDIAGTAFKEKAVGMYSKGGTGSGARPLYFLAKKMSK